MYTCDFLLVVENVPYSMAFSFRSKKIEKAVRMKFRSNIFSAYSSPMTYCGIVFSELLALRHLKFVIPVDTVTIYVTLVLARLKTG